jgi:hypothetical protein
LNPEEVGDTCVPVLPRAWKDSSDLAMGEENYKIIIMIIRTVCGVQAAKNATGHGYH